MLYPAILKHANTMRPEDDETPSCKSSQQAKSMPCTLVMTQALQEPFGAMAADKFRWPRNIILINPMTAVHHDEAAISMAMDCRALVLF